MKSCRIRLDVPAVDAYLYGGYLFIFKADGSVGYIRFERLLGICSDDSKDGFRDMKLAFLPFQTLKGGSYDFMMEYPFVKFALYNEMERAAADRVWDVAFPDIEDYFHRFSEFEDLPLDVSIYGGHVFMGSSDGLFKSALNADQKYNLEPEKLTKVFDGEAIHLSSKCGTVAVSSAENGLFAYPLVGNEYVDDRPVFDGYSVRSEWSVGDSLLNYRSNNEFSLLINRIGLVDVNPYLPKGFRDDMLLKRSVELFGEKQILMEELFQKNRSLEANLSYMFSSVSSGFFITDEGELEVRNLQDNHDRIYYSSKALFTKDLNEILKKENPISAKTFPGGCVIELYDKVLLVYKDDVQVIAEEPVFSVRTYMSSNSYRNLITVVFADRVEIIAVPMLPEKGRGASSFKPIVPSDDEFGSKILNPSIHQIFSQIAPSTDDDEDLPF